jgi:uncharacterized protein (TIGR02118 family)
MARLVAIYKTPKDVAAFERHYFETHVPLAERCPDSGNMRSAADLFRSSLGQPTCI